MALHNWYPTTEHNSLFELNKDFSFSAAHFIGTEEAGKCQQLHGHNYTVNLTIVGDELDRSGFLVDFKKLKELVHDRYDHTVLNNHAEYANANYPSTEIVAATIHAIVQEHLSELPHGPECIQVIVRETDTSYVVYRPINYNGLEVFFDGQPAE